MLRKIEFLGFGKYHRGTGILIDSLNLFITSILCIIGLFAALIWPIAALSLWVLGEKGLVWKVLFLGDGMASYSIAGESSLLPFNMTVLQLLVCSTCTESVLI
jgi:hypothetical protein